MLNKYENQWRDLLLPLTSLKRYYVSLSKEQLDKLLDDMASGNVNINTLSIQCTFGHYLCCVDEITAKYYIDREKI